MRRALSRAPSRSTYSLSDSGARWREKGVALGATRIGVHAGPAIVGNFGGGRFFDYTAYGDTINIAARLKPRTSSSARASASAPSVADGWRIFAAGRCGDLVLRGTTGAAFAPSSH